MYMYMYVCVYVCMYVGMYMYMYVCMCVCNVYVYVTISYHSSSRNMPDGSVGSSSGSSLNASLFGSGQVVCTDKHSEDAFHLIHGHLRTGFGLRPSRSYDMLTKIDGEKERFDKEGSVEMLSVSAGSSYSLPYGASPK